MKRYVSASFILTTIMLFSLVFAYPLEISVEPKEHVTDINHAVRFNLTIKNNRNVDDSFSIMVRGERLSWFMPGKFVQGVKKLSSESIDLVFYPTGPYEGTFEFQVFVKSTTVPDIIASENFYITIPYSFNMSNLTLQRDGTILTAEVELQSTKKKNINVIFELRDSNGNLIDWSPVYVTFAGKENISTTFVLSPYLLAGEYTVVAYVEGTDLRTAKSFYIEPVHNVVEIKEEKVSPLYKEVKITVRNDGNVLERNYTASYESSIDFMTGMLTKPQNCIVSGDVLRCTKVIDEIRPGEEKTITYRVDYWPTYMVYLVMALIVIGLIGFSFFKATSPKIKKKRVKRGEDTHTIILEIKNPFRKNLSNVIVRDWVSPLAKVIHEEIDAVKPIIRRSEAGTELIWKLGNIKPKEERILTYKIKTLIHGSLKMPKAYIRFTDEKGKRYKIYSKQIILE
ncbi:MAG: hypothetical protein DRP15_03715 [Candidatus Aenigmatarchaeota archaeon]|nr:MAG: hypothetical protein DRP15_03715 [Candidatus Aenigmarchaeota archaeon]